MGRTVCLCVTLIVVCATLAMGCASTEPAEWEGYPIPADPGEGHVWQLQSLSDEFNYTARPDSKGTQFTQKWVDTYHNAWLGPGLTEWRTDHSWVADGRMVIASGRKPGTDQVYAGIISSKETVVYPLYVEARVRISNMVLATAVWLLSPDDTQEIDVVEAYGSDRAGQEWFAQRAHISHHVFSRQPFQDYQPRDAGSWLYSSTAWREDYHRFGVYWRDPWHLAYYVDGQLVRTVSGPSMVDPNDFTGGKGLNKAMHVIIDTEDQDWRSDNGITPTDAELADDDKRMFYIDWIRFYKPVEGRSDGSGQ